MRATSRKLKIVQNATLTVPVYVALGGLFYTIGFDQVNVLVIAMLVEMLRSRLTGKSLQSGGWLAAAIVLKVMPAYLALSVDAARQARRIGVIIGLFVGLLGGPGCHARSATNRGGLQEFRQPHSAAGYYRHRQRRYSAGLFDQVASDSQSFYGAFWFLAPAHARLAHNAMSMVLTLATLFVAWRTDLRPPIKQIIFVGALMLLMALIVPVSHMHYYAFGVVLAAGLWLKGLSQTSVVWPGWRVMLPLVAWGVGTALPFTEIMSFEGEGVACSVMLWIVALVKLGERDVQFVAT